MNSLKNKNVFISGSDQGIGYATAHALIDEGCNIALHYHVGGEGARALEAYAKEKGCSMQGPESEDISELNVLKEG